MTNEEAVEIVLKAADKSADFNPNHFKIKEAVSQVTHILYGIVNKREN